MCLDYIKGHYNLSILQNNYSMFCQGYVVSYFICVILLKCFIEVLYFNPICNEKVITFVLLYPLDKSLLNLLKVIVCTFNNSN